MVGQSAVCNDYILTRDDQLRTILPTTIPKMKSAPMTSSLETLTSIASTTRITNTTMTMMTSGDHIQPKNTTHSKRLPIVVTCKPTEPPTLLVVDNGTTLHFRIQG